MVSTNDGGKLKRMLRGSLTGCETIKDSVSLQGLVFPESGCLGMPTKARSKLHRRLYVI